MSKILVIEDKGSILSFLRLELQHEGYEVITAQDGDTVLVTLEQHGIDLILLDIMLKHINGLTVLRSIRKFSEVPVIILTVRGETTDEVLGRDYGANDYLTIPFDIEELLARIRYVLKKKERIQMDTLSFDDISMNIATRCVTVGSENIELSTKEFDLLLLLIENSNQAMTRGQILSKVWGYDFFGDPKVVDVYVHYLRHKLDDRFSKNYITTIRGVGYVMMAHI